MEQAPENSKELLNSAHANGMNESSKAQLVTSEYNLPELNVEVVKDCSCTAGSRFNGEQISIFNSLISADSNQLYKEVPLCIFSVDLFISFADQIILWTQHKFT
jgi:hypothetical protein